MLEGDFRLPANSYHRRFERLTDNILHRLKLQRFYAGSLRQVRDLGWQHPLERNNPHILLCGTGSKTTSEEFAKLVFYNNPSATITVLDVNPYPLKSSKKTLARDFGGELSSVNYVVADALSMPFQNETIDGIETDSFLQFFSQEQKEELLAQWQRILKPHGIITTRDYVQNNTRTSESIIDNQRIELLRRVYGVETHSISEEELQNMFTKNGFEVGIASMKIPYVSIDVPVVKYITARKRA